MIGTEGRGGEELAAYLLMDPSAAPESVAIRKELGTRLPGYMIPARVFFVDRFPHTATGKIDRRALAGTDAVEGGASGSLILPQDELERCIAARFQKLLSRDEVGRDEDFFLLGGDSLQATQLHFELESRFGPFPFQALLKEPTVAGIAGAVRELETSRTPGDRPEPVLIPLREAGSNPIFFLVHGGEGHAFVSPNFMDLLGDDQPLYGFEARGMDGVHAPHPSVRDMAEDYIRAMRNVQAQGPYFIGALCGGSIVALEMARQLGQKNQRFLPLVLLDPPKNPRIANFVLRNLFKIYWRFILRMPYRIQVRTYFVRKIINRLRGDDRGRTSFDTRNARLLRAAISVNLHFKIALLDHSPAVHTEPVYILGSGKRLRERGWTGPRLWLNVLVGKVERYVVAEGHKEVLVPRNAEFAERLGHCMAESLATSVPATRRP